MKRIVLFFILLAGLLLSGAGNIENKEFNPEESDYLSQKELQEDFLQFRQILEKEHCCIYEYSSKAQLDSIFDLHYSLIDSTMSEVKFFQILASITARIGCMHTATWMPGRFFNPNADNMFPLKIKLIENYVVVTGTYNSEIEIPVGSILLEINGLPVWTIIKGLRQITSADARNTYFIDAQLSKRFSMFYASLFGFPEKHIVKYKLPGSTIVETKILTSSTLESVREYIFANFNNPPLEFQVLKEQNVAVMTIKTFIYYDKVDYFTNFIDSCFSLIRKENIKNLVLDLRGNDGGDPFCAASLLSYLQKSPVPYFAEPYQKYADLTKPLPMPENHFTGNLYTLLDGHCGSTNGHFSALLKYNKIGKFVGTPGGSTYKCNAGKNTEFRLPNSQMIITIGRSTYSAAVEGMDKRAPIYPDIYVTETYNDFLDERDKFMETAMKQIIYLQGQDIKIYPALYDSKPEVLSPFDLNDTTETILVITKENKYGVVPVTMENGKPLLYSYKVGTLMGKDQQQAVGGADFPPLAKTGLHSEEQLDNKTLITGIPVDVINCTARPNGYSYAGFMAEDEDIISVLKGDNRLVSKMGLTHSQMAKPLFHIWNLILKEIELGNWARFYDNIKCIIYNNNVLNFSANGSKGWQISIFFDEVQGRYNIHIDRELTAGENNYLETEYSHLDNKARALLKKKLTTLDFSEMNPYYIVKYGFYEGHTEYRCNPIAIALIFGLRSLEEIDKAFGGKLLDVLTSHYIAED